MSKRDDVLRGAFEVFAEVGYGAASVDAIAERAKVSVRTLYNHFPGKEELFGAVLEASAARVAEEHLRLMDRELLRATDLEAALTRFAVAWLDPSPGAADHFRLMHRIATERSQLPARAVEAWRRIGPARVKARLAEHLARFEELGLLRLDDPRRAALQFASLVSQGETWVSGATPMGAEERRAVVASGVRLFLFGCATADATRSHAGTSPRARTRRRGARPAPPPRRPPAPAP